MSESAPDDALDILNGAHARGSAIRTPLLLAAVALSVAVAILAAVLLLGSFADTDDTLQKAAMAGCERNNVLRREVNRQAEAFVHHNDATLVWAIKVRPVLADGGTPETERAYRATGDLVQAYREVRKQYLRLPLVNCEKPAPSQKPTEPVHP